MNELLKSKNHKNFLKSIELDTRLGRDPKTLWIQQDCTGNVFTHLLQNSSRMTLHKKTWGISVHMIHKKGDSSK